MHQMPFLPFGDDKEHLHRNCDQGCWLIPSTDDNGCGHDPGFILLAGPTEIVIYFSGSLGPAQHADKRLGKNLTQKWMLLWGAW